ncbi:MAG: hybrid sensor histidine kinase/response regulator [Hyphomonas sp.]|uniref:hybrid sensor histidine kinase/response regulator n=1 Tax=Hyphomonas sp. TaxID=87 RepID=UPI0025BED807|nr:response regulator [Hyphomonas sp.]MBA4337740.1 hybrid sensor histidine kinase/response regulator [Hyphomonas sp.]
MKKDSEALDLSQVLGAPEETDAGTGSVAGRKVDLLQLGFWACLLLSIAAASVSLVRPHASGATGSILLITMASGGLVFLLWTVRGAGRFIGLFPERGAAARFTDAAAPRFPWIEALDEAVLVTEPGGAPVAANPAFNELAAMALITGPSESGPVTVDRLFGANPGLAAPVYRLSKAAKAGTRRRELLPPVALGPEQVPAQFEVTVAPLPRGRVLWRIRRIAGQLEATGAADMKSLYVEDAPMGFFAARPDGTITYANGYLRELLGLPETAKNIRLDDIMRPEFVKLLGRDRKSGAPGRADIQLRARDGVEIPVQAITTWSGRGADANGRTILLPSPQILNGEGDRFALQGASRPMRADGDPMFDDAPFGAVRLDGDRVDGAIILDANRALMELSGGRATPGSRFSDLFDFDEDGAKGAAEALVQAVDKPVALKLAGAVSEDKVKHVNVFVTLNATGRPSVAYVVDISEHRLLEQRLAHGEKMQAIGNIAGRIAHEINNMLQVTQGNCEFLENRHPLGDPSYDNLKAIHESTVRSADLVRGLLAYAREQTFKREVFNTTDFLTHFSLLLRGAVDERIAFEVVHGRDVPWIRADKSQIETAIINLVTNARDAMLSHRDGGRLTIRTSRSTGREAQAKGFDYVEDGDYLLIEVEDTGGGIPKELREKIFHPFFTTKEKGSGTGLGLATVFGIIKQSGGYIEPVSVMGKGTNFHVYLPALAAEDIPQAEDPAVAQRALARPIDLSGRGRILVIEDEAGVRNIAVTVLRSRGYEVEEAEDGEEALEIINAKPGHFDLVISDVVMPGMNGPTLIKQAREKLGHARVIFISGYAEQELAKQLDDRAVSFLPKPFSVRQLSELVKTEIGTPQQEAA